MKTGGVYLQLFSIHGLIRGDAPELGRDADTGGQVKYVLELARALAKHPDVEQVDLVTRLIEDNTVAKAYGQMIEPLSDKARIVRIQCGGKKYIRKELLWPHLGEFVDKMLKFIKTSGRVPDVCHGHYADGGLVAQEIASIFRVPFIFTGHSMGRHKKNKLLGEGMSEAEINRRYRIDHRIDIEEKIIRDAAQIIASTRNEVEKQYGLYDNFDLARHFEVIPPGIDIDTFYPYYDTQLEKDVSDELAKQARVTLLQELHRFWTEQHKPFILALCRPDQRKNISGLITAYGGDKDLRAIANLAIFAGIRKNINIMEENERNVLTDMLLLMDQYDLYGKLAIPKKHDFQIEVPELYRLCAESRGVFVNPALVEPFGLTLIEAASCGVPIVATKDGGPADIVRNCQNGILVDPTEPKDIAAEIKRIIVDKDLWGNYSRNGINGVRDHYSWGSHCLHTMEIIKKIRAEKSAIDLAKGHRWGVGVGQRLTTIKRLLIVDIDDILVGDEAALAELLDLLKTQRERIGWGVATGRCLEKTVNLLKENGIPKPDIFICSVGTEIYYGPKITKDKGWQMHLAHQWKPHLINKALAEQEFLNPQEPETQRRFKISYYMKDDPDLQAQLHRTLQAKRLRYNMIFSSGQFLDILPYRASKGKAIRYLSYKWELPMVNIMVCGVSGNDDDMLRGDACGLVVANYSEELEQLRGKRRIYFSDQEYAAGVIDGLKHYKFLSTQ
jgi:sucrose-phosphate synthase